MNELFLRLSELLSVKDGAKCLEARGQHGYQLLELLQGPRLPQELHEPNDSSAAQAPPRSFCTSFLDVGG